MTRAILTFGLMAAVAVGAGRAADDKKGDAGAKLAGAYTIVSGEESGKKLPDEHIKGAIVQFSNDEVIVTDRNKKQTYAAKYKLDTSKKPWHITMTATLAPQKGEMAKGLVEKEGGTLKLIYALPGGGEPTDFKTKDKQLMFVLKPLGKKEGR